MTFMVTLGSGLVVEFVFSYFVICNIKMADVLISAEKFINYLINMTFMKRPWQKGWR